MAIIASEIAQYYAARRNQSNPAANGGRPSGTAVRCGQLHNIWPKVTTAQRLSGQTLAEKLFVRNRNAANETAGDAWIVLDKPTGHDEYEWIVGGDQDGMQTDIPAGARRYAAATLASAVAAGAASIDIALPNADLADCFQTGDTVIIYSGGPLDGNATRWEAAVVASVAGSGTGLTLTLASPATLAHAAGGFCCSAWLPGADFAPRIADIAQSGAGSYDIINHPIVLSNRGTIRQNWTLTYTSATQLEVSGDELGSLGEFAIASDIAPMDASGNPYFTLSAGGHGDGHAAGDTLSFKTWAAAYGVWRFKRTPPGAGTIETTSTMLVCSVE